MTPTISINVDVRNPGQVFACMGLFELANCLIEHGGQAFAWFEELTVSITRFHLAAYNSNSHPVTLEDIVPALKKCTVKEMPYNQREGPIHLGEPFNLIVDWRDPYPRKRSAKTWAGQQSIASIVHDLLCHLPDSTGIDLLFMNSVLDGAVTFFNATQSMGALDVGFSHNEIKRYDISVFPACELLCLIGLQRACPHEVDRYSRQYAVWKDALPLNAAALVASTTVKVQHAADFTFEMFKRSPDGKYKSFAPARPVTR